MKFDRLTPMLCTNELKNTVEFYRNILGFEIDEYREDWNWCHIHRNGVNLMFTVPFAGINYHGTPSFTGSFYIYTQEVDALWEDLKSKTNVSYEITNFSHNMREFGIYDNNGYLLQFGRELREGEVISDCD
jgi:uncharacterized glyoxalase superfamily protein PhnB